MTTKLFIDFLLQNFGIGQSLGRQKLIKLAIPSNLFNNILSQLLRNG
jgi:hypothetical protein